MPKQPGICGLSNTSRLDQRRLCRDPFLCASRPWLAVFTRGPTWVEQNHVVICVVQVSCPIRINFESGACPACQWMSQDVIGFFFIRRLRRVRASLSAAQVVQKPCLGWRMSRLRDSIYIWLWIKPVKPLKTGTRFLPILSIDHPMTQTHMALSENN